MLVRMWRKGNPVQCWWECKSVQPLWKKTWWFLRKVKRELPHGPGSPLLGIYLKKMKTLTSKDICTFIFTAALFTIAKTWKQPKHPSMDEWIKKICHIYIYIYIYIFHNMYN